MFVHHKGNQLIFWAFMDKEVIISGAIGFLACLFFCRLSNLEESCDSLAMGHVKIILCDNNVKCTDMACMNSALWSQQCLHVFMSDTPEG